MNYSELVSFKPIESTIRLLETADKKVAQDMVRTYVMSDEMAERMKTAVIDQLQMEEAADNKAVMIVGNYGTGKSHLMSVIAAIASDRENLRFVGNQRFAGEMENIAGKFEVLRLKVDGLTMSLREILLAEIEEDFASRGIVYAVPDLNQVRDHARLVGEMMQAFQSKYPDKGYLIVIDELLSYLMSRDERQVVLDLVFLQTVAEMCPKSRVRLLCGVQERVFEHPRFHFAGEMLKKVGDRFTQVFLTKEATAYVVAERILKKTPEQKARIRQHLEKFSKLYGGMSSRMEEFVELFPIHPSYIGVFDKIYMIENRHILKTISLTVRDILGEQVPEDAPGILSFDEYWPVVRSDGLLRVEENVRRVVETGSQLEEIIDRSFAKAAYRPMAKRILHALSVYRLTTNGLDVPLGLTEERLKDDLCLHLPMPEQDADFLLGAVHAAMGEIMKTVSGQFIVYNESNNQYYLDVEKTVDYDERIRQRASMVTEDELNGSFYDVVYDCLGWDAKECVNGFKLYPYDLNWDSHNVFREGYLFMGPPGERSTTQPDKDFYLSFMPPFGDGSADIHNQDGEVSVYFRGNDEFRENLRLYAAANAQAEISGGKDRDTYLGKAAIRRKWLTKALNENKNTCFHIACKGRRCPLTEVLSGTYRTDRTFQDTMDLAASICLEEHFETRYPEYPVMGTKITRKNQTEYVRAAVDSFAGKKSRQAKVMLQSFGILEGDQIRPEGSRYASYYIDQVNKLRPQEVLNCSELFESADGRLSMDKKFKIDALFMPIIFLSLVYAGYGEITWKDGSRLTASNLGEVPKISVSELCEFQYLSRPAQTSVPALRKLLEMLDLDVAISDHPNDPKNGVAELLRKAEEQNRSAVLAERALTEGFELWGEPLADERQVTAMRDAAHAVKKEFGNYPSKFNTPAKLRRFRLSEEEVERLRKQMGLLHRVSEYQAFQTACRDVVGYLSNMEQMELGADLRSAIENGKDAFREARDSISDGTAGAAAAGRALARLETIKETYIALYLKEHKRQRLDTVDAERLHKLLEGQELRNLQKLRTIELLPDAALSRLEQDIEELKVCDSLTLQELKSSPLCPHCRFRPGEKGKDASGQMEQLEERIDEMTAEWTKRLLDALADPVVLPQKRFLKIREAEAVEDFITKKTLPRRVDDLFVNSIHVLLKGMEPVVIRTEELAHEMEKLPPMDARSFQASMNELIAGYIKGKNPERLRILVKRGER